MTDIRIGSLCTGYGGLDMAVRAVFGGRLAWVADPAPGPAAILAHHHPHVANLGDITRIDWRRVAQVDVLAAGFPCQDISHAGKRAGITEGTRSGIWANVAHAIGHLRPRFVVLENVAAITVRGLDRVAGDLAGLGFDAEWTCLRASDVGAPHRRERWFCLAWPTDTNRVGGPVVADSPRVGLHRPRPTRHGRPGPAHGRDTATDAAGIRRHSRWSEPTRLPRRSGPTERGGTAVADADRAGPRPELDREPYRPEAVDEHEVVDAPGRVLDWGAYAPAIARWEHVTGRTAPAPTEPGRNGPRLSAPFVEWLMGLPAGHVTAVPGLTRTAQLTALGNGVVPLHAETAIRSLCARIEGATA